MFQHLSRIFWVLCVLLYCFLTKMIKFPISMKFNALDKSFCHPRKDSSSLFTVLCSPLHDKNIAFSEKCLVTLPSVIPSALENKHAHPWNTLWVLAVFPEQTVLVCMNQICNTPIKTWFWIWFKISRFSVSYPFSLLCNKQIILCIYIYSSYLLVYNEQ